MPTRLIYLLIVMMALSFVSIRAEEPQMTALETALRQRGVVYVREDNHIGNFENDDSRMHIAAIIIRSSNTNPVKGISIWIWTEARQEEAFIDLTDISAVSTAVGRIIELISSPFTGMREVKYVTKYGDLEIEVRQFNASQIISVCAGRYLPAVYVMKEASSLRAFKGYLDDSLAFLTKAK